MISPVLLSAAVLAGALAGDGAAADPSDLGLYKSAAAAAGHDALAHVRLSLWCEAHNLSAERIKHLALAILYDPSNALARGLSGLVAYQGKWGRPEIIQDQIQNDPAYQALVREYLDRRSRTGHTANAQMKLAAWCDQEGLKEQALAHYNEVIRLDPSREAAWKHLGYKRQGHRWVKPADLAAEKQEAARQKQADKHWKPTLEKLRDDLQTKDAAKRARAEQGLIEVTDPRALPMIWALFVRGNERLQIAAVQLLGQIDGPSASNGLAALAIFSPRPEVRTRATETLTRRDPRDFWKAGKGWTMARELKAGDRLRMVDGVLEIKSIETDKTQPVYNLDVAENRDFFVGTKGLLVHDFSFVQPVLEPFDRQPELTSLVPSAN